MKILWSALLHRATITRRPASADRTARRQFQAVFPVITGSFQSNIVAHLHGLSMDLDEQWVQLLIRQLVELLD